MQKLTTVKKALARKYPEQVVLVTARNTDGKANVMAVGWVAVASDDPPMFVLGIDDGAYTYELIRNTKQFVVAFPGEAMAREVLFAGTHHGHARDKLAESGLVTQDGQAGRAPLIAEAVANFECDLVAVYQPGDCPLVIGKVVAAHEHSDPAVRRLYTVAPGHVLAGVRPANPL